MSATTTSLLFKEFYSPIIRNINPFLAKADFWTKICHGPHTQTKQQLRLNNIVHTSGKNRVKLNCQCDYILPKEWNMRHITLLEICNGSSSAFVLFSYLLVYCQIRIFFFLKLPCQVLGESKWFCTEYSPLKCFLRATYLWSHFPGAVPWSLLSISELPDSFPSFISAG